MRLLLWVLSLGTAAVLVCACSDATLRKPKAVVVVLIDSLRPDHINAYGYSERLTTPELDRLIEDGLSFSNAYSNSPWTVPSVMSLMTSLYPSAHGYNLEAHLLPANIPGLGRRMRTLPELFQEAGFVTAAFTASGAVSADYGLDRGFDTFEETKPVDGADVETVVAKSLAWLEKNWHRSFFLFVHTYEVHLPHTHDRLLQAGRNDSVEKAASRGYDADLRFTDAVLARLWGELHSKGIYDESIIVVLSDHGEALYDRRILGRGDDHGYHLYDELLRVPMIFIAPAYPEKRGTEIDVPVQLIDVLPTVAELAGIERPDVPFQGISLVPLFRGRGIPDRPLFAEAPFQGPGWIAVRFDDFKYISAPERHSHQGPEMWWDSNQMTPREVLYDLRSDPGETMDILAQRPEKAALLREQADRMRKSSQRIRLLMQHNEQKKLIDPELLERLKSLGYIE